MSSFVIKSIGNALNATSMVASSYASRKALHLFASPRKGRYTEAEMTIVNKSKQAFLEFEGLKIATYEWKGTGKTVLLAHGWESNASRWHYILKALQEQNYNIIAIDAPVHGQSEGKFFSAVLYAEFLSVACKKYKPDTIIGHSVGGMASVFCQYNQQFSFLERLIILGAPAHFTGVFSRYKKMMGYNTRISKGLDHLVKKHFGKPVDYFSAAEFARSIDCLTLIIHDQHDKIIPHEDAVLFHNRFPKSELISTSGFGHSLKDVSLTSQITNFINN